MKRNQTILLGVVVLVLLALLFVPAVFYTVDEREQAVVLQFGKPVETVQAGLHMKKPLIQDVHRLPKTKQFWRTAEGEQLVDLPTSGGKKIEVAAWAIWQITDPEQFIRQLKTVRGAEAYLVDKVRSEIRDVITNHKLSEVVRSTDRELTYSIRFQRPDQQPLSEQKPPEEVQEMTQQEGPRQPGAAEKVDLGRKELLTMVQDRVQQQLQAVQQEDAASRGIKLVDVGISNISFVPAVREAAFERLKAFMESIAAGYENEGIQKKKEIINETKAEIEKILGEAEREASIIRGEADAKVIEQYAKAVNQTKEFYQFVRTLEVNKQALTGQSRLILTTDSELFRLLKRLGQTELTPPATAQEAAEAIGTEKLKAGEAAEATGTEKLKAGSN